MKMKHLIYCLSILTLCYACSSSSTDDLSDPDPDPNEGKLTYDDDIKTIFTNNCITCHGEPPTSGAPFSLTTFDSAKNRIDAILSRINNASSPMPPQGLMAQGLRDNIQQWKDDGLLEN